MESEESGRRRTLDVRPGSSDWAGCLGFQRVVGVACVFGRDGDGGAFKIVNKSDWV